MEMIELVPGLLHMFRFGVGQAYLWQDPGSLTLIDAGPPGQGPAIARELEGLGLGADDLDRVILTHFHGDHAGSAADVAAWGSAAVMASGADAPVIRGDQPGPPPVLTDEERPLHARIMAAARGASEQADTADIAGGRTVTAGGHTDTAGGHTATTEGAASNRSGGLARVPPCRVDRELAEGDLLDFAGGATVIGVPGHTDGSIAIHLPAHRLLFTGDSVASAQDGRVILGPFNVNRAQAIDSFRKLADLDVDVACFGHGDPVRSDAAAVLRAATQRGGFGLTP
jgi:glyoxylase-like metal-dependent hydrolase (beta-lactamase superfamily II)